MFIINRIITLLTLNPTEPPTRFYGNSVWEQYWRQFLTRIPPGTENPPDRFFGDSPDTPNIILDILEWAGRGIYNFAVNVVLPVLPELVTLAVVGCAICLMVTGESSKWWGKMTMVFLVGASILMMT